MTLIDIVRIQPQRGIPRAYEGAWLRRSATTLSRQMNEILKPIDVPLND
ncbi:hypothetical protein [Streptomyces venezuelae]